MKQKEKQKDMADYRHFFVYKSCLKHAKNKIFDNFCDWMQKSKLLVLCLKAVFGCPKPGYTKPVYVLDMF